jgi:hypothetical protein
MTEIEVYHSREQIRSVLRFEIVFEGEGTGYYHIKPKSDECGEYLLLTKIKPTDPLYKLKIEKYPVLMLTGAGEKLEQAF